MVISAKLHTSNILWTEKVVLMYLGVWICTYITTINLKRGQPLIWKKNQDVLYTGFEGRKGREK